MDAKTFEDVIMASRRDAVIAKMELVIANAKRAIFTLEKDGYVNSLGELQMTAHGADVACAAYCASKEALEYLTEPTAAKERK